jgi:hypothetical protein
MGLCPVEVMETVVVENTSETRNGNEASVEQAINLFTQSLRSSNLTPRSLSPVYAPSCLSLVC